MPLELDLTRIFQTVRDALLEQREAFNQLDPFNQDHGDHMLQIFEIAVQAVRQEGESSLADAMRSASDLLSQQADNGSALVYARGLKCLADEFADRQIELHDLSPYVRAYLHGKEKGEASQEEVQEGRSGEILKALLNALAAWEQAEAGEDGTNSALDLGYLFGIGMAYMGAKGKGGDKLQVLAETVISSSPLGRVPHRHQSGVFVVRTLLHAMGEDPSGLAAGS